VVKLNINSYTLTSKMICYYILPLLSLHIIFQSCYCSTTTSTTATVSQIEASNNVIASNHTNSVAKLDGAAFLPKKPRLICHNESDMFMRTYDEVKENCDRQGGILEKGIFHFDLAPVEPEFEDNDDEALDLFVSQLDATTDKSKLKSRKKRVERETEHITEFVNEEGVFVCLGCITADNQIVSADVVKMDNGTGDCENGSTECETRPKPDIAFDVILAGLVSFMFCVLLLAILTCHPMIIDGPYLPLRNFSFTRRSRQLMNVLYRNHPFDENDFTIVDFE